MIDKVYVETMTRLNGSVVMIMIRLCE